MDARTTMSRHPDILSLIGNTPVVRINQLAPGHVNLYVKLEAFNPMGSVKDRMARSVIEAAERSGALKPGQTVIEATSGNTGIGLAMVCAAKGYPLVLVMAESFSVERRKILRFMGADVVLTPAALKGTGMLEKAEELAAEHDWFLVRQFENEANADAHTRTTAVEILEQFADTRLDYWVTGYGTGGTLKGTSRVLRERSPETRIVVCEPDNSPLLGSGIPQPRDPDGKASASHPMFRPHLMQGWTPDFVPRLTQDAVDGALFDEIVAVDGNQALALARDLARKEGIFAGVSGAATLAGALAVAENAAPGSNILCMLPDTGERYLSTPLFDDISVDMSERELEISRSTPGARFDVCAAPAPAPAASTEPPAIKPEVAAMVDAMINDPDQPVVLFALEWCEFCWSVRNLFSSYGIPYRSVDLDSVTYQKDNLGGEIRAVLLERTGQPTIPQIFIGGEWIGGCSDLMEGWAEGTVTDRLLAAGVEPDPSVDRDPRSFLPKWQHPR